MSNVIRSLLEGFIAVWVAILLNSYLNAQTPYGSVNTFVGTGNGGNTFPGATLPYGMTQWSPDTNSHALYNYTDRTILGFSLTHMSGAGCGNFGDFAVLPTTAALTSNPLDNFAQFAAPFTHTGEIAEPGYYAVTLANGIRSEFTVTARGGMARFFFQKGQPARIFVNGSSSYDPLMDSLPDKHVYSDEVSLTGSESYTGSVTAGAICSHPSQYTLYVAGQFSVPCKAAKLWQHGSGRPDEFDDVSPVCTGARRSQNANVSARHTGLWLDFGKVSEVDLKVGISYAGVSGAVANLKAEIPGWDFATIHADAKIEWSNLLDRIQITGGTAEQLSIFYTCLYHMLLAPNIFSDKDGSYPGFNDGLIHHVTGTRQGMHYANFSDWDTYRGEIQFQSLFDANRTGDMMQSLVNDAEQLGWLPRWPSTNDAVWSMDGDSSPVLLADAYAFGVRNFDTSAALKYMIKGATTYGVTVRGNAERPFLPQYLTRGYVPVDLDNHAASRTLEFANDDFAVAQMAKSLGDTAHYDSLLRQSSNWETLFDPSTLSIRPRNSDGAWLAGFDPVKGLPRNRENKTSPYQEGFKEGNTAQYSFMLPFDYPSLFSKMGGDAAASTRLDSFFSAFDCTSDPCYNAGNENDFVFPYAYVFAGEPWKTQDLVTRIEAATYSNGPDGLPGNDDLGATSAWYVWSSLGLYPVVPGIGGFVIGSPLFPRATVTLPGERTLTITRKGVGNYVQNMTLNGAPYTSTWLPVSKLGTSTTLAFVMGEIPNTKRGTSIGDRPPEFR